MNRRVVGKQMVITINIERHASGLYVAKSKQAAGFLASHTDECALRAQLPFMVQVWAMENGLADVSVRILPPAKANRGDTLRLAVTHQARSPEPALVA